MEWPTSSIRRKPSCVNHGDDVGAEHGIVQGLGGLDPTPRGPARSTATT